MCTSEESNRRRCRKCSRIVGGRGCGATHKLCQVQCRFTRTSHSSPRLVWVHWGKEVRRVTCSMTVKTLSRWLFASFTRMWWLMAFVLYLCTHYLSGLITQSSCFASDLTLLQRWPEYCKLQLTSLLSLDLIVYNCVFVHLPARGHPLYIWNGQWSLKADTDVTADTAIIWCEVLGARRLVFPPSCTSHSVLKR